MKNCDVTVNPRDPNFLEFMQTNGYVLIKGRSLSDHPAILTHYSKNGSGVIHLVFVNVPTLSEVKKCYVATDAGLLDDFWVKLGLFAIEDENKENLGIEKSTPTSRTRLTWVPAKLEEYQPGISQANLSLDTNQSETMVQAYKNLVLEII